MSLNEDDVRKIAFLARIRVDEARLAPLADELNNIVGWVEQFSAVDIATPLRKDVVNDGDKVEDILANAPDREGSFFAVPKVVE
jgi:aspartyl-tRNA(Asn)/glutamyl-tRNA(Gln) amidotransferase subunit C